MKIIISIVLITIVLAFSRVIGKKSNFIKPEYISVLLLMISFQLALSSMQYEIVGGLLKYSINFGTLVLLVLLMFVWNRDTFSISPEYIFFGVYLLQNLVFIISRSQVYDGPTMVQYNLTVFSIYLIYLITNSIRNIDVNHFLYMFNFFAIANGLLAIAQMITKKTLIIGSADTSILYTEGVVDSLRAVGFAGSNNAGGNLGALLFVVCAYNVMRKQDLVSISALGLDLLFIALTQTRIALVAVVVCAIVIIFSFKPTSIKQMQLGVVFVLVGILIVVIVLSVTYHQIITVLFADRGDTQSARGIQYMNGWLYAICRHPLLGIGTGQWRAYLYNNFQLIDIPIHSQYLNYWIENGLFVFLANIFFNLYVFGKAIKNTSINRKVKTFVITLFIANIIVTNFNPNEGYIINNIVYYLLLMVVQKGRVVSKIVGDDEQIQLVR